MTNRDGPQDGYLQQQRRNWLAGQGVTVEQLLAEDAELEEQSELVLDLIYGEFLARELSGQPESFSSFARRFPGYAEPLRRQLELHRALQAFAGEGSVVGRASSPGPHSRSPDSSTSLDDASDWQRRLEIPGYEILAELGRGGMGVVFKARQSALGREVAIKAVRSEFFHSEDAVTSFPKGSRGDCSTQSPEFRPNPRLWYLS